MKISHLDKRLHKVESALRLEPDNQMDCICALLWFAVAYYLGNPSRGEKPFAAYARALGYASESELNNALEANDRELWKRFVEAEIRLYAKFDCSPECDGNKFSEGLQSMMVELPKSYKDQMEWVITQAKISLAWMHNESGDVAAFIRCFA